MRCARCGGLLTPELDGSGDLRCVSCGRFKYSGAVLEVKATRFGPRIRPERKRRLRPARVELDEGDDEPLFLPVPRVRVRPPLGRRGLTSLLLRDE